MGAIVFDDAAARNVISAPREADDRLRGVGAHRRSATEDAATDFSGAYAQRFTAAGESEERDRVRLARALDDLAEQVERTIADARRERERLDDLQRWAVREDAREHAAAANTLAPFGVVPAVLYDPKPSETPIRPMPIAAVFSASDRPRLAGGSAGGTSSAHPDRLRAFAASVRVSDRDLVDVAARLRTAWSAFTARCPWAVIDSASLLAGFERYLDENRADADWIERIADAFERAGGGHRLSNAVLDVAAAATIPQPFRKLLAGGLSPTKAAELWSSLGLGAAQRAELAALPLAVLGSLGNLEGIPYWVRDTANRAVLAARMRRRNLDPVERAALQDISASLGGGRHLVALTADVPPLAAVAIGDLDTADNVTWAVPGMGSSTLTMSSWAETGEILLEEQGFVGGPKRGSIIAWIGYDVPPIPDIVNRDLGVLSEASADAGAGALAASIRGLLAARSAHPPRTNVLAHSYGTTTASLALTKSGVQVDSFTSLASAGIPQRIESAADLRAEEVYAAQAENTMVAVPGFGDQYAYVGRDFSFPYRQDPTNRSFGATVFGADGEGDLKPVKDHGVHTSSGHGYLDPGTESLRNAAFTTTGQGKHVTGGR